MPSGKTSKRKRAAQRVPAPPPARATARPTRLWWLLGAVVAAIVIAVVSGVLLTRGEGETIEQGASLPDAGAAAAVFRGVPQQGVVLGRADAPVTVVEFLDLQCPFCREFAVETLPRLVERHVRTGDVRLELRGLAFIGNDSVRGMRAAVAASRQNRMFEFTELLFYNQGPENSGWLSADLIDAAARSVPGLDPERLAEDADSDAVGDVVEEHAADAERRSVNSTPTVFVGRTGGELSRVELTSPSDLGAIERAIEASSTGQ